MTFKLTLLLCAFTGIALTTLGQKKPTAPLAPVSAKDFFVPATGKNKAIFFTPDAAGKKSNDGRVIYYVLSESNVPAPADTAKPAPVEAKPAPAKTPAKANGGASSKAAATPAPDPNMLLKYNVVDMNMYGEQVIGTEKQSVEVSYSEVKVVKSVFNNLLDKNKPIDYSPPLTILKIPKSGQKAYWTYTDRTNKDYKCTAEWLDVMVDGQKKRAIRVTTERTEEDKHIGKTMAYYVAGCGLWKTEYIDPKGTKQVVDQFDKLDYDLAIPGN